MFQDFKRDFKSKRQFAYIVYYTNAKTAGLINISHNFSIKKRVVTIR